MWLCKILGLAPNRSEALESAFDPATFVRKSAFSSNSRQFGASPEQQAGGGFTRVRGQANKLASNGIIPSSGVKVP